MNNFTPKYGLANFNAVKKNTIKKLLQLDLWSYPCKSDL